MKITFVDRLVVKITLNHLFVVNTCITLVDWLVLRYVCMCMYVFKIACILTDRVVVKVNLNSWLVVNISA